MKRRKFIGLSASGLLPATGLMAAATSSIQPTPAPVSDRTYWADTLHRIASPVMANMAKGQLKKKMTVEYSPIWDGRDKSVAYMEAFGRLIAGIAPWLALPADKSPEDAKRQGLLQQTLESLVSAVDPANPDYLTWDKEGQPLVDSSYIANAFLRAPKTLWEPLDNTTKQRFIAAFKTIRRIKPAYNNWLLFAAMNEAFLLSIGQEYDPMRIDVALHKMEEWYAGDGWFSDGPHFHFDYYNGFVIQPMLVDIQRQMPQRKKEYELAVKRMQRYAEFLERLISPEGTFPAFGRSVTYRVGAFQPLAQLALMDQLPEGVSRGQTRAAMTAIIRRIFEAPGTFSADGWLQLGFAGHQPNLADYYSNSGSMYLTSLGFLPLGLPPSHPFWTEPAADWTQRKAWSGQPFKKDYAVDF